MTIARAWYLLRKYTSIHHPLSGILHVWDAWRIHRNPWPK